MPMKGKYTASYKTDKMESMSESMMEHCSQMKHPGYDDVGMHTPPEKEHGPKVKGSQKKNKDY